MDGGPPERWNANWSASFFLHWLQESHGDIRIEFRAAGFMGWHVEPLGIDGEWTEKDAGFGLDLPLRAGVGHQQAIASNDTKFRMLQCKI